MIWTVVLWGDDDEVGQPVGPTSGDPQLLRLTLDYARRRGRAEIVEWGRRNHTYRQVRALKEAREAERENADERDRQIEPVKE